MLDRAEARLVGGQAEGQSEKKAAGSGWAAQGRAASGTGRGARVRRRALLSPVVDSGKRWRTGPTHRVALVRVRPCAEKSLCKGDVVVVGGDVERPSEGQLAERLHLRQREQGAPKGQLSGSSAE